MKKLIKTLSILLIATVCTVCVVLFAACGDKGGELATDKIYITVLDENGNPIDGPNFGLQDWTDGVAQVEIQFCTVNGNEGGCASYNAPVGADGKAEFPLSVVHDLNDNHDVVVEVHVLYVTVKKGYKKEYNQYKISEIPKNITIKLEKAGN